MKKMNRIADRYAVFAKWAAYISGIVVIVMMLYTVVDVGGRYLAKHPAPAAYEFTNIFLIYVTYFGVTIVQARGGHMRLGFLYEKAGPRGKALIDLVSSAFGLFIVGVITWQGWLYAIDSWVVQEVTLGAYTIPVFPGRIALAIGATIFLVQYVIDFIRNSTVLANPGAVGPSPAPTSGPGNVNSNPGEAGAR
jgi:TRAP-type C4-dicarboxylate transport system permease small subunit